MSPITDQASLDRLFVEARTHTKWLAKPVDQSVLKEIYNLARMGPTSVNCQPARFVFVISPAAKAKLKPALAPGNVDKTMAAPVTVIVAHDLGFYDHLPKTFPQVDARPWFADNDPLAEPTAFRNGTLQGGYLILAARSMGLDCGPMSGFDNATVDAAFFPGGKVKSNFLINIGYGDASALHPRNPRLDFSEACLIA